MNSSLSSKNDMKFNFQATAMDWFRARAHLESKLNDRDSKVYISSQIKLENEAHRKVQSMRTFLFSNMSYSTQKHPQRIDLLFKNIYMS